MDRTGYEYSLCTHGVYHRSTRIGTVSHGRVHRCAMDGMEISKRAVDSTRSSRTILGRMASRHLRLPFRRHHTRDGNLPDIRLHPTELDRKPNHRSRTPTRHTARHGQPSKKNNNDSRKRTTSQPNSLRRIVYMARGFHRLALVHDFRNNTDTYKTFPL